MRYLCCAASAPQHPGRHRVANQLLRQQPVGESRSPALTTNPVDLPLPASLYLRCRLDPDGPADRKKIALGTKPISLRTFRCGGQPDFPYLLHFVARLAWPLCFPHGLHASRQSHSPGSQHAIPSHSRCLAPPCPRCLYASRSRGAAAVFAASDRPTVIYSANRKLLYSNLNENEVGGADGRMGGQLAWGGGAGRFRECCAVNCAAVLFSPAK